MFYNFPPFSAKSAFSIKFLASFLANEANNTAIIRTFNVYNSNIAKVHNTSLINNDIF